jgi:hypothetical protein
VLFKRGSPNYSWNAVRSAGYPPSSSSIYLLDLYTQRLIAAVAKADNRPINKDMLIKKHYKGFAKFTKQIDKIKEINS